MYPDLDAYESHPCLTPLNHELLTGNPKDVLLLAYNHH